MLKQNLQQKLLQKLSPLQIQTIKLLELPLMQLEQRIKKELEENPVLEEEEELNLDELNKQDAEEKENDDEFSLEDYIEDEDTPLYKLSANNNSKDDEKKDFALLSSSVDLQQSLEEQLGFQYLNNREHTLGLFLIGSLDDDGYLHRDLDSVVDDVAFKMNIETSKEELEQILMSIQELDPPGVGARSLKECLLIQLSRKNKRTPGLDAAARILENCYDEFIKKHYDKIASKLGLDEVMLKSAVNEIIKLTPKPGAGFDNMYSEQAQQVIPDFLLEMKNNEPVLSSSSYNMPELRISRDYSNIMGNIVNKQDTATLEERNAAIFVKQKIDSAKWFIDAIRQRQNTLMNTMRAIIEFQKEYFKTGNSSLLRPMILKDIAETTGLDVSTVSRVVNSKYIQTEWGVFPLRYFFSEGIQADSGEEVSTREVKRIIAECVEREDKGHPLTDEALMDYLKDKGYTVARRTVAKYREKMNIPVGRLRKEL